MTSVESDTVKTMEEIVAAFNRHDVDAVMAFFAEECSMDLPRGPSPWGRRCVGKDEVRAAVADRFAGLPDAHYGDASHWASGERGVSEWTLAGTTPAGTQVEVRGCDHWRFHDGKVVRKDSYWKIVE